MAIATSLAARFIIPASLLIILAVLGATVVVSVQETERIAGDAEQLADGRLDSLVRLLEVTDSIVSDQVQSSMRLLRQRGDALGPPSLGPLVKVQQRSLPELLLGDRPQANRFELVDGVTAIMGGTATLFVRSGDDFVRVSTNVQRDGVRAVGTILDPGGKAMAAIRRGEPFYGEVDILGSAFLTGYEPIRGADSQVIGIYYVGYQLDLAVLRSIVRSSPILRRGFIAVLDENGRVRYHSDNISAADAVEIVSSAVPHPQWQVTVRRFAAWGFQVAVAYHRDELAEQTRRTLILVLVGGVLVCGLLIGVLWRLVRRLVLLPLGGEPALATQLAQAIAGGDLSQAIVLKPGDERSLMASMQQMQSGLRQMIAQIDSSSQELLAAAAALTQAAAGMAQSSSEQSATASGMAQTLFRVAGGVAELADSAHKTDQTAYAAGALAHQGSELVGRIVNEMYGTAVVVRHLAEAIDELDKQAAEISSVVSLIRDVADQTDVLSLNAAMEAARAGQHGRGFSAVADEVRKLSERTAKSSRAVATMIDGIQHSARATSEEVAAGSQRVQDNVTQMNQVGQAMQQIRVGTDEVMAAISTISKSLAQQSTANREISSDVERVAALTQKSSDSAQEISAATQRLATLATTLRAAVSRFKR